MSDSKGREGAVAARATSKRSKRTVDANKAAILKSEKTSAHPTVGEMVIEAVGKLNEKGGSSLQAIKKFMVANHQADLDKLSTYIRKFLKGAVEKKILVQTRGKGASGSFKLAEKQKTKEVKVKQVSVDKKPAAKKTKVVPVTAEPAPIAEVKAKVPVKKAAQKKVPAKKPATEAPAKKIAAAKEDVPASTRKASTRDKSTPSAKSKAKPATKTAPIKPSASKAPKLKLPKSLPSKRT